MSEYSKAQNKSVNLSQIWDKQELSDSMIKAIQVISEFVSQKILQPPEGISNIGEWCKKDACWTGLKGCISELNKVVPHEFNKDLTSIAEIIEEYKDASKTQKIDNGIEAQKSVLKYSGAQWEHILESGTAKGIFTPKEIGIFEVASKIPAKIPSEKQSIILVETLEKAKLEGISAQ